MIKTKTTKMEYLKNANFFLKIYPMQIIIICINEKFQAERVI